MEDINQNLIPETTNLEIAVTKPKRLGIKKNNKEKTLNNDVNFQAFYALAELMNKSVEEVKDECCLFQVRNIMNKITKVIVI